MRPKQGTALRKLFSLPSTYPLPDKISLRLWNKIFFMGIYRQIQTVAFKVLQEGGSWVSRNGAVQMLSLTPNMFSGKFIKSERVSAVLREQIVLNAK